MKDRNLAPRQIVEHLAGARGPRDVASDDHLWWDQEARELASPQQLVWNAEALHRSIEQLTNCSFEWVLAGHGGRVWLPQSEMRAAVRELVERRQ